MTIPNCRKLISALLLVLAVTHGLPPGAAAVTPPETQTTPQQEAEAQEKEREGEAREGETRDEETAAGTEASLVSAAPGRTILAGLVSHGLAREINSSTDTDVTTVALRWSRVFGTTDGRFLGARPGIGVEIVPAMLFHQDPTAWAAGFHLLYEHRFVTDGVLPTLRLGAGFLHGNREVPPGETRHNFSLLAGLGLDIPVGRATALTLEYRLHHVSNANTGTINPGINAHTAVAGVSFYF
ncbi:MAG: acyloxyacyl hydrolase [Acidobacteriota bacterium]